MLVVMLARSGNVRLLLFALSSCFILFLEFCCKRKCIICNMGTGDAMRVACYYIDNFSVGSELVMKLESTSIRYATWLI